MNTNPAAEIRAIVVTDDNAAVRILTVLFQEIGVAAEIARHTESLPDELKHTKFEALVVDCDAVANASTILHRARNNPANSKALFFAIATGTAGRQRAVADGANFVFERPFVPRDIRNVLRTTCELLIRERRRYFRCSVEVPALIVDKKTGIDMPCKTINVSRSGVAVLTPSPLALGSMVDVILFLQPPSPTFQAGGIVVWDDKHGKSGISFNCMAANMQAQLDLWLDTRFTKLLSPQHRSQWLSQ